MRIFRAARFLFAMGLTVDAVRLLRGTVLALALYVAAPLAALALRDFTDDVLARHAGPALAAAVLASVALVAQLMLPHFCHLDLSRVSDAQEMRLRGELMDLVNGPPRIDHLDSSDVADTVALVRDSLFATAKSLDGVLQLAGLLLQMIDHHRPPRHGQPAVRAPAAVRRGTGAGRADCAGRSGRRPGTDSRAVPARQPPARTRDCHGLGPGTAAVRCRGRDPPAPAGRLGRGDHAMWRPSSRPPCTGRSARDSSPSVTPAPLRRNCTARCTGTPPPAAWYS